MSIVDFALFGSAVWFWILFGVFVIALFVSEAKEQGWAATVSLVIFAGVVYYGGEMDTDWLLSIFTWKVVGGYLVIGLIFALVRFYFYGREHGAKLKQTRQEYAKKKDIQGAWTEEQETEFKNSHYYKEIHADEDEMKYKASRWWLNWPVSLLWWLVSDWFLHVWNLAYDKTKKFFRSVYEAGVQSASK